MAAPFPFSPAVIALACGILSGHSTGHAADAPYEIVSEQIEPFPLPYQAAVFRRSVRNRTDMALSAPYPEEGAAIKSCKGPDEDEFHRLHGEVLGAGRPFHADGALPKKNALVPLELPPNYETTVSFSIGGAWTSEEDVAPLFYEPGKYVLRFKTGKPLSIVVNAPKGDDKVIRDILAADPPLAAALLSPTLRPADDLIPKINRLAGLYPESSYAEYARFALLRAHFPAGYVADLSGIPAWNIRLAFGEVQFQSFFQDQAYAAEISVLTARMLETPLSDGRDDHVRRVEKELRESFTDSYVRLDYLAGRLSGKEWIALNPRAPARIPAERDNGDPP